MTTSFDGYAAQRKTRWSLGQRAAHEVAERAFGDGTAISNDVGVNISALLEDDDFFLCIATAVGIRTWADAADLWDIADESMKDAEVRAKAVEDLRERLLESFAGYKPTGEEQR